MISDDTLDDGFRLPVPEEDVAAIRAGDDEFTLRSVITDSFDGGVIPVTLVAVQVVGNIGPRRGERINIFVVVTGQDFAAVVIVDGARNVSTDGRIQLKPKNKQKINQN